MSKSLGNIVVPWDVIDRHGADAFRWYFLTSKQPWDGYLFSTRDGRRVGAPVPAAAVEHVRLLRAVRERQRRRAEPTRAGDRPRPLGAVAAARATVETVHRAPRRLRRDARRPRDRRRSSTSSPTGTCAARAGASGTATRPRSRTLHTLPGHGRAAARAVHARSSPTRSTTTSTAPSRASTSTDWPERRRRATRRSRSAMARRARDRAARAAPRARRRSSRCASRCARRSSSPPARERAAIERLADVVREELNVKELRYVVAGRRARLLRGQAQLPRARPALRQADAAGGGGGRGARPGARRRRRCATARASASASTATTTSSAPTTCMLAMQPLEGYQLEREGSHAVALELELDDELRREGLAREIVHAVQNARKAAGLEVEDRIELALGGDDELLAAARAHEDYVARRDARRRASPTTAHRRRRRPRDHRGRASCGSRSARAVGRSGRARARARPRGASWASRPMTFLASWPLRKRISVGIERTSNSAAVCWFSSTLSLTISQVVALGGDLLEDRGDDAARTAPGRPEVDEHGRVGLDDLGLEVGVGDVVDVPAIARSPRSGRLRFRKYSDASSVRGVTRRARASSVRRDPDLDAPRQRRGPGRRSPTVTNVAASSSFQRLAAAGDRPRGEREEQRDQLRQRVRRAAPRAAAAGEMSSCGGERRRPRCRARRPGCRARTAWRATTKPIASGPALSWTLRHDAGVALGPCGSDEPAMKPATQAARAARARARCGRGRSRRRRASAGALTPGKQTPASGRASTTSAITHVGDQQQRRAIGEAPSAHGAQRRATGAAFQRRSVRARVGPALDEREFVRRSCLSAIGSMRARSRAPPPWPAAQRGHAARPPRARSAATSSSRPARAVAEDDRHLDDAEAAAQRAVGQLDLEGVALRAHASARSIAAQHVGAEALEAAGEVAHRRGRGRARAYQQPPRLTTRRSRPQSLDAAAGDVARAEREVGARRARARAGAARSAGSCEKSASISTT